MTEKNITKDRFEFNIETKNSIIPSMNINGVKVDDEKKEIYLTLTDKLSKYNIANPLKVDIGEDRFYSDYDILDEEGNIENRIRYYDCKIKSYDKNEIILSFKHSIKYKIEDNNTACYYNDGLTKEQQATLDYEEKNENHKEFHNNIKDTYYHFLEYLKVYVDIMRNNGMTENDWREDYFELMDTFNGLKKLIDNMIENNKLIKK